MRNQKIKLSISDYILNANKVLKAVEKKLPDEILNYCGVSFKESYPYGYVLKFQYYSDGTLTKEVEVCFRVSDYDAWVWFDETTWFIKEDYRREKNSYHVEIKPPAKVYKPDEKNVWEKRKRYLHNEAVSYIVSNISKYFGSNAEKFIANIK
jgi:hypothetical protein